MPYRVFEKEVISLRTIILITIAIILLSFAAYAAPTAGISVPKEGDHYYWFSYSDINGKQITTTPRGFKDKKTTVDLPLVKDAVPKCSLFVLDANTGNEAVVSVEGKSTEARKFNLKSSDFDKVRRVEIKITSASTRQPAAAAVVRMEGGDKKVQTQVIDPSSEGIVQFTDVPSGTVKVTVEYGEGKTTSQDIDIPIEREEIVPAVEVPVVGEIETVQAAAAGESGKQSKRHTPQMAINFPVALVGLILFVGIIYLAYITMRNRGVAAKNVLKSLGVDLPEDQQASASSQPAPAPVDPTVCPFCGGKKDPATGACSCSVAGGPTAVVAGEGTGPRLIATQGVYAGSSYTLEADTVTIGREETNNIAFPQDSTSSRRHAQITKSGGEFTIRDEGSSNGTFVNGVKVTEQVLKPGDEIQIGNTKLRFEV